MIVKKPKLKKTWWEDGIKWRHRGSERFLQEVWRGVYAAEKKRVRPKVLRKELSGRALGMSHVSAHVVEGISRREANLAVGNFDEKLIINSEYGKLYLSADDDGLQDFCKMIAKKCSEKLHDSPMPGWEIREILWSYGLELPIYDVLGLWGALLRTVEEKWWRRQVRRLKAQRVDEIARSLRMVHASSQVYCSNELHRIKRSQRARNRKILENNQATNDQGDVYTLAELSDLSTSNPAIRRAELMMRMRGFENMADDFGHKGVFITLTAPSFFHPMRQIKDKKGRLLRVVPNKLWQGATVVQAQAWMNKSWSLIRAAWGRAGIQCYGFRVVEPHHDGCPHWHALLFFDNDRDKIADAIRLLRKKMMREFSEEKGALRHRVRVVMIDKRRGSATGYIAKYIAKNIDGTHVDGDLFGNDAQVAAHRICDWASGHHIRQFQQIGGPSVSVWRELRKMDISDGYVELARQAADESDWQAFCLMQGGPFIKARQQPIKVGYWIETKINYDTGEVVDMDKSKNMYGENSHGRIFGVVAFGVNYLSRFYRWSVGSVINTVFKAVSKKVLAAARELSGAALFPGGFGGVECPGDGAADILSDDDWSDYLRGDGYV